MHKIKWNEITWYSRMSAVLFFIGILPVITFVMGVEFQKAKHDIDASLQTQEATEANLRTQVERLSEPGNLYGSPVKSLPNSR